MNYGFEAQNSSSKVTISSDWDILKFSGKGNVNFHSIIRNITFASGLVIRYYYTEVDSPVIPNGEYPTMFFHFPTGYNTVLHSISSIGGGRWRAAFSSFYDVVPECYWFYKSAMAPSQDTHGMRLYGPGEEIIFDSGWNYKDLLEVRDVRSVTAAVGNSFTIATGILKPAIMFHSCYWHHQKTTSVHEWFYRLGPSRNDRKYTLVEIVVHYNSVSYQLDGSNTYYTDSRGLIVPVIDGSRYD